MRKNPHSCEIGEKIVWTVEECAAATGIGQIKLRALLDEPDCPFRLMNGNKRMILKNEFEKYLTRVQKI